MNNTPAGAVALAVGVNVAVGERVGVPFGAQAHPAAVALGVGHLAPMQATMGDRLGVRVAVVWETVAQAAAVKQTMNVPITRGIGREKNVMARL